MAEQCKECGAVLVARQRFCRRCGAAILKASAEDTPTKVFQPEAETSASPLTSPLSGSPTDQVRQQPTAYSAAEARRASAPPHPLTTGKSSRRRFLPFLLIGLVGVAFLAGLKLARLPRRIVMIKEGPAAAPPAPPPVKVIVNKPSASGAGLMNEEGAIVSDDKTIIAGSYPLGDNATVSLTNITGQITIEGWDQPQAEVRVTKEGGSIEDRQAVQVKTDSRGDSLSLETNVTRSSPVEVNYEIKLPRRVRQIQIKSADSAVRLSKLTGAIEVSLQGSSIEMDDVGGAIQTKIIKGATKATLNGISSGPHEFTSVSGDIEIHLAGTLNAEISAETIDGEIEADDVLKMKVDERPMGQSATGSIGKGGDSIRIKTVNGDIKIKK